MEIVRLEQVEDEKYICSKNKGSFGFVVLKNNIKKSKTCEVTVAQVNIEFHTNFTLEQFTEAIESLSDYHFTVLVSSFISHCNGCKHTKYKLTRQLQEMFGEVLEIKDSDINNDHNGTGFNLFLDDENNNMIVALNMHGDVTKVAFRLDYLPIFFDTKNSIDLDVFQDIPKEMLLNKLIEHYIVGFYFCRKELAKIIKSYTRKRKINLLLDLI